MIGPVLSTIDIGSEGHRDILAECEFEDEECEIGDNQNCASREVRLWLSPEPKRAGTD